MAVIALAALFGLPVAAHASVLTAAPAPIGAIANLHTGDDESNQGSEDDQSDEGDSGSTGTAPTSGDKDDSFVVPPMVGTVERTSTGVVQGQPASVEGPASIGSVAPTRINPDALPEGQAIQVERVVPSVKTPTDLFVDTAVLGLGAIGSGALVLGGVVGARAIKARRSGEKFDYFYGDK